MNKLIRTLIASAAFGAATLALPAQPALKLVVVDMVKVLDGYYKAEEANAKFGKDNQKAQEQLDELNKQMQALADQYKDLLEQSKNSVLKPEVRAQAESDAQKKMQEFQQRQADAQNFRTNTQRSIQQRMKTYRDLLFEEITKVVNDIARAKGATLVLDKSGPSLIGVPLVVSSDPGFDITDEVLKEVNKDRPPPAPLAPAASPASAPAAPGGTTPQFSVPNVTPPANPADKKP